MAPPPEESFHIKPGAKESDRVYERTGRWYPIVFFQEWSTVVVREPEGSEVSTSGLFEEKKQKK